jgi:uncharacterized protein DUF5665
MEPQGHDERSLQASIERLTAVQASLASPWRSFVRGVYSGFGVFVSSALIVGVLVYVLSLMNTAPLVGEYISNVLEFIQPPYR